MTVAALAIVPQPSADVHDADDVARLNALLDPVFLDRAGWLPQISTWRPLSTDPLSGYQICQSAGCSTVIGHRRSLCASCSALWKAANLPLEQFLATHQRHAKGFGEVCCAVEGCQRPAKNGRQRLCFTHLSHQISSGLDVGEFLAEPGLEPFAHPGACRIHWCDSRRYSDAMALCQSHTRRVQELRRRDSNFDLESWMVTAPPKRDGRQVDMRGLHPRVIAEMLYGIQQRHRHGWITEIHRIRGLCGLAREISARSLADVTARSVTQKKLLSTILSAVSEALADGDLQTEMAKDEWNLGVFGQPRRMLKFSAISQQWLRDLAKHWVIEEMPRRRGDRIGGSMQSVVSALGRLSESLRIQREDHGGQPHCLGSLDVVAFLNRMAYLQSDGQITLAMRNRDVANARRVLTDMRNRGKRVPGDLASVLPAEFTILAEDIPQLDTGDEPGRALPNPVMAALCAALPLLQDQAGRDIRVAVELLIDTGRRPDEICRLPMDCLDTGPDGKHTLIYHDFKNNRAGCRLAIPDATAEVIREQHQRIRALHPHIPVNTLALIPALRRNPDGTRPMADNAISVAHRTWVDSLPPLTTAGEVEFDKSAIVPYTYRHSYAQRHADAGVPPDVLRELMGHKSMRTTQIYYRVTGERTRKAVEKVAAHQFDRNGQRVWQQTQALLDDEHARLRIGQVAVPFGVCLEPSNVKAGGQSCPFRFRCLGCTHFRTDATYLPELKDYLQTLLRDRERVLATSDLDHWAHTEAVPSEAEISKLRELIHRVETSMNDLTDGERAEIEQAAAALRRSRRTVNLGMPAVPALIDRTQGAA